MVVVLYRGLRMEERDGSADYGADDETDVQNQISDEDWLPNQLEPTRVTAPWVAYTL